MLEIFRVFKWVFLGGFALGVISLILIYLPDQNLNNLGEGLKALAQVISDLPRMLPIIILLLIAIILVNIILKLNTD